MTNILRSRQSNRGETPRSLSQQEKEQEKVETRLASRAETKGLSSGLRSGSVSLSLSGRSDSDKENSRASKRRREVAEAEAEEKPDGEKRRSVMPAAVSEGEGGQGASCDWAYWYQPTTGTIKPAQVTVRSRPAPAPVSEVREEKPWRAGMKKAGPEPAVVSQQKIPEKTQPVKPWRANMRSEPRPVQPEEVKPRPEERAWRNNMKKVRPVEAVSATVPPRRRHYDRGEVRQFIREKKLRERGEHEEREKEENLQAEVVKRRLAELDKLQREIREADTRQNFRRASRTERNLSEPAQEALREKLLELTEEMKSRWRERERAGRRRQLQPAVLPPVLPQTFHFSEAARPEQNISLQPAPPLTSHHLQESPGVISVSEVSDATELKSLSENPRNVSSGAEGSSKLWKERLQETQTGLEETVYKQLEKPRPLTDQIPERDLSKSEKLRQIVKDVLDRHKTDLDFISSNMKEASVTVQPGEEFSPKYPTILTTPPSLPELESRPRPVPTNPHLQEVLSDSSRESEKPPQWLEVTRDEAEPDQAGAMATVMRKYSVVPPRPLRAPDNTSIPSDMAISEGVLSDMSISSHPPSPPIVDSKTYSKDIPDVLGKVLSVLNIFYFSVQVLLRNDHRRPALRR